MKNQLNQKKLEEIKKMFNLDFIKLPNETTKEIYKDAVAFGVKAGNDNPESWLDESKVFALIISSEGNHRKINHYKDPDKAYINLSENKAIEKILNLDSTNINNSSSLNKTNSNLKAQEILEANLINLVINSKMSQILKAKIKLIIKQKELDDLFRKNNKDIKLAKDTKLNLQKQEIKQKELKKKIIKARYFIKNKIIKKKVNSNAIKP